MAQKEGIPSGTSTLFITVEPGNGTTTEVTAQSLLDRNARRLPYIVLLSTFLAVDALFGVILVRKRKITDQSSSDHIT